jgi:hypothetical protein
MNYWVIDRNGKVYKGKSYDGKYHSTMIPYGCRLYNPYTQTTIIGWNDYKRSMNDSYKKRFGKK